jgi:hypothetical protein
MSLYRAKRPKKAKNVWVSDSIHFSDEDTEYIRVRHESVAIGPSRSLKFQSSYMSTNASPKKSIGIMHDIRSSFGHDLQSQSHTLGDTSCLDPDYVAHIEEKTGRPPKRGQTVGVGARPNICSLSDIFRTSPFACLPWKSIASCANSFVSRAEETTTIKIALAVTFAWRQFDVKIASVEIYGAGSVRLNFMHTTLFIVYKCILPLLS